VKTSPALGPAPLLSSPPTRSLPLVEGGEERIGEGMIGRPLGLHHTLMSTLGLSPRPAETETIAGRSVRSAST